MKQQIDDLNFIAEQCREIYSHFENVQISIIQKTCLGLIKRLGDCSSAIAVLLPAAVNNPGLEFPAGIVLRSIVLDSLPGYYIFKMHVDAANQQEAPEKIASDIEKFCLSTLSDGFTYTFKFIDWARKNNYFKTDAEIHRLYQLFSVEYAEF